MAKLDPSTLRAEPITDDTQVRKPHDLTDREKFIAKIKGMLVGDEYHYAEHTLRGILANVEKQSTITPNQRAAIDNIEAKPYRGTSRDRRKAGW